MREHTDQHRAIAAELKAIGVTHGHDHRGAEVWARHGVDIRTGRGRRTDHLALILGVGDILEAEATARRERAVREAVEAVDTTDAVRSFLRSEIGSRGFERPEVKDRSDLAKLASRPKTSRYGRDPYVPEPGCACRLHLRRAVRFRYCQEAYSDDSEYAVPVTVPEDADLDVCRRNLQRFVASLRTHDGTAGSGCTWDAELRGAGVGAFVVLHCRASIAD